MSDDNPCIGICEIEDGYCIGCGRSADEIFGNSDSPPGGTADAVAVDAARPLPGESVEASD